MAKITWRTKLYLFAAIIAILPLAISSFNMIGITRDEVKSNVNTDLIRTAGGVAEEINNLYTQNWLTPLLLVKSGIELQGIDIAGVYMQSVIDNSVDLLSLNLFLEIEPEVFGLALKARNAAILEEKSDYDEEGVYSIDAGDLDEMIPSGKRFSRPAYIEDVGMWVITCIVPVETGTGYPSYLAAKISLNSLYNKIAGHPFKENGDLYLIDRDGRKLFSQDTTDLSDFKLVKLAKEILQAGRRGQIVETFTKPDGKEIVGSYSFPLNMPWAVIAERDEEEAYIAVGKMQTTLGLWALVGLGIAFILLFISSRQISKPISKLSGVAGEISGGNFDVKVDYHAKDEIGFLGDTLVEMAQSLKKSFATITKQNKELEEYSHTLEDKVARRTAELKQKNEDLELAMKKLKDTQDQLISHEKLASLGALTAGIAHEIQNPLNFVNNFGKLSAGLVDELNEELADFKEEIPDEALDIIEEILEDLKLNVTKISEHGGRAQGIVKGMLQHSRADTGEMQMADLNEMVKESMNLTYHGIRSKDQEFNIKMNSEFDPAIGKIKINPQALNRVFLNIINNGFYAANERKKKDSGHNPEFWLKTEKSGDNAVVRLRDNGTGIPEKILKKIFEPFFTTKPTGEGTGLGLSLSYDIVTKMHKGELKVETKENEYTEFIISIPLSL